MPQPPAVARAIDAPSDEPASSEGVIRLIRAIAAGDTMAFAEFYEAWFDRALALACSLTRRDDHFCLDIVQDAMIRVSRSLSPRLGIATVADLDRWMVRVIHTTALDALRKESRRRVRESRSVKDRAGPRAAASQTFPANAPGSPAAHHATFLAERIDWLRARLDELDAEERSLLAARFGSDATLDRIARAHGISPGAATGRLTRLLIRLRLLSPESLRDD